MATKNGQSAVDTAPAGATGGPGGNSGRDGDGGSALEQALNASAGRGHGPEGGQAASSGGDAARSPVGDEPLARGGKDPDGLDSLDFVEAGRLIMAKLEEWYAAFVTAIPNLLLAVIVVLAFALAGRILCRIILRGLGPRVRSQAATRIAASTIKVGVTIVGLLFALQILDLRGTALSLLAGAGVVGIALGFAFQDITENFIIGFMMSIRKPFQVNDIIKTHGYMGYVRDVNLRNTILESFLGQHIIIPNRDVYKNPIENYNATGWRKLEYTFFLDYDEDIEQAQQVAADALEGLEFVSDRSDVELFATQFCEFAVEVLLRVRIDFPDTSYFTSRDAAAKTLLRGFRDAGIRIPRPIRTLEFPSNAMKADSGVSGAGARRSRLGNDARESRHGQGHSDPAVETEGEAAEGET